MRIAYLGDLGTLLDEMQRAALADVKVLLIPVGGNYTIDAKQAASIIEDLPSTRLVIPMHFKTSSLDFPIDGVHKFVKGRPNAWYSRSPDIEVTKESLPKETEIAVLGHLL